MYQVSFSADSPVTYFLEDSQSRSELNLVPERGGIVTQWRIQGQPVFYFDEDRFQDPSLSVRGGIPILFPICGNLPDNRYRIEEKAYQLKQHGFARDLPWEVIGQEQQNSACLDLKLSHTDETLAVFPFPFELVFRYALKGNHLKIIQRIVNLGDRRMPFSLGLHPYFFCRDKASLQLEIPASGYRDQLHGGESAYDGTLDFSRPELDLAFTAITAQQAQLKAPDRNFSVTLTFSELYQTLVFWAVQGKDYVCLEPWSAPRNALNSGEQLAWVEPFSSQEAWVQFTVNL